MMMFMAPTEEEKRRYAEIMREEAENPWSQLGPGEYWVDSDDEVDDFETDQERLYDRLANGETLTPYDSEEENSGSGESDEDEEN